MRTITHVAQPGPDYWSYRCLRCSAPIWNHHRAAWVWWRKMTMMRRLQQLRSAMDITAFEHFVKNVWLAP